MMRMKAVFIFVLIAGLGCGGSDPTSANNSDGPTAVAENLFVTTSSGLKYYDITVGSGTAATNGSLVTVHYQGWLQGGVKIDSSIDRGTPFAFAIGFGEVISGWEEGITDMRVGGKRQLVIPPALAYGTSGSPPVVPPNATLVFEVEVLAVE